MINIEKRLLKRLLKVFLGRAGCTERTSRLGLKKAMQAGETGCEANLGGLRRD